MSGSGNYVDFYSGTEVEILRVKSLLEEEKIPSLIQNDFQSGNLGGFLGGTPSTIRLKVREVDFVRAGAVIRGN